MVLLWGSNARETHPIFFHHLIKGIHNGARLYAIDPRQTSSAAWAERHLQLDVGSDIALALSMAREIIAQKLYNPAFIERATLGFEAFAAHVEPCTLTWGEAQTGVPAAQIAEAAHAYARADKAMICWTLGITEHRNAVDNVLALINLGLLCGHVGRYGSGLNPLRGQNNVQGGGDAGALPHKLPGFQDVENAAVRQRFELAWDCAIPPKNGLNLTQMFEAIDHGELRSVYCIGENPAQSEADAGRTHRLLRSLDHLVVQDIFFTQTAEMAEVVLPVSAAWCESEGTVTNSERRVQRVRKALAPPGVARDDVWVIAELSRRLGVDLGPPEPERLWDEMRSLSPMHTGMSWKRLEELDGIQWPCPSADHPGTPFLHARLWQEPIEGRRAPFSNVLVSAPAEALSRDYPLRLTTGRRLDAYNTGVQTSSYTSPLHRGETLDLSPEDAAQLQLVPGELARVVSRRGSVQAPVRIDRGLKPGLCFLSFHYPDQVATNLLTIDATDPKSGTAEFKAAAVRVEKLAPAAAEGEARGSAPI